MRIIDILNKSEITVSCELFPPKKNEEIPEVKRVIKDTVALNPAYISITCGAGGNGASDNTVTLAGEIEKSGAAKQIPALAHLTCVSSEHSEIISVLDELRSRNIENILALRGDIPDGFSGKFHYRHASDLMREISEYGGFCIGGACYPEGHPESPTLERDIEFLRVKTENGCEFLTTQVFFDNDILYNYMFRLLKQRVDVPVVAGIMPVTNARQIERICKLCGTKLSPRFKAIVDKFGENPAAMRQAGMAYATEQIIDLIANGVGHIHIYTMNKPDIAAEIMNNLSEILK